MADEQMPHHGAQAFGVRGDALGVEGRDHDARVRRLLGEAAVASHHT